MVNRPGTSLATFMFGMAMLAAGLVACRPLGSNAQPLDVLGSVPAFALVDQLGRPVTSDDLRGKVAVADFIYTSCPDVCPLLTERMKAVQDRLGAAGLLGNRVRLLSFTVDPAHDTVPVLRAYAEQHQANAAAWQFLTGPEQYVLPLIVQGFHLAARPVPGSPDVLHDSHAVLVDRAGQVRAYYDGADLDPERVLRDVRQLLQ